MVYLKEQFVGEPTNTSFAQRLVLYHLLKHKSSQTFTYLSFRNTIKSHNKANQAIVKTLKECFELQNLFFCFLKSDLTNILHFYFQIPERMNSSSYRN